MNLKTKDIVQVALFAALTAVGAFITIPFPFVPFTLQSFFTAFAGVLLGAKLGMLSQLVYVVVGLVGVPVFTKGGGPGYIFETSFGYLIGFIVGAYVIGKLSERVTKMTVQKLFLIIMTGILVVYMIGVPYLYMIMRLYIKSDVAISWAVRVGFTTTIGGDIVKSIIVAFIGFKIVPILSRQNLISRRGFHELRIHNK
ncbi:biotin transport system substrate-specific component [Natranaerovirga pectinivora]|uniref:Biotin transporter n=1 Tax=Natranaerovirga pectinivora TaxID=682400 RepID=A0A4R3MIX6_9FIRM|nr:biotin transporter BioY [Natranaerovirga pectinivora]TCT14214.1 biotin transport system substrate-specific component [Natranaerovirga pectinivora]